MKAKPIFDDDGKLYGVRIRCAHCSGHVLPVRWLPPGKEESPYVQGKPHWDFNGNFESPTFSPSILSTANFGPRKEPHVCHSFVREGRIQYLSDCTHPDAGKTLDLLEIIGEDPT